MNTVKRNASEKNITMHHNPGAVVKPKKKLYKQKLAELLVFIFLLR